MTWRSFSRLRVSLLLLIFLALLPAFGLIVYTAANQRRLAYREIQERAMRQAGRFAALQELRIAAVRHLFTGLAQLPAVHAHDPNSCTDVFQEIQKRFPELTAVVAATPNGEVFCSGVPFPRGTNLADRAYFQRALETRRFTVGEYVIGRVTGKPIVTLAYAAVDRSGTVRAVLAAGLDLSWLGPVAAQAGLAPGAVVSIIDRSGTILSRYPDHERWVGKSVPGFVQSAVVRNERLSETQGVDGIRRFYARTPLQPEGTGTADAYVTVGIPTESARIEVDRLLTRNLTVYGIVAVLVFLGAWVGSDVFVLRRINTLLVAARRLGAGDLSARTELRHGPGELEQLARAFDDMAERLGQDTAELRRAEVAARTSETRFRALLDGAPDAVVVAGRDGRIVEVNGQAELMFGYARDELLGHPVEMLIPERARHEYSEHRAGYVSVPAGRAMGSGLTLTGRRQDGTEVPVEISLSPVEIEGDLLVIRVIRDVTEQRRAAEEIAAQRRFLRAVIDLDPNLIFTKDRLGRFTLANKAVADAYGTTPEALIGKSDADVNPNAEQVERFRRDDLEVLETGRDKFIHEERITDATGQERWLQTVKRAIAAVDGTANHVLGVATDITERKGLEIQLFQTQKLEAIGQLAGGVAHDFNNLLTVILGRCALLLSRLSPDASPRRDIDLIEKTAQRAAALTRQLLAFSRKQILEPKVLDLNAVVPGIATMLQRLIGEDIELVYRPGAELGRVKADPGQLEQVIMNLAVNARDAMPDGGRITIETGNVELGEHYARQHVGVQPGQYVMLALSDTGIGMDVATQARIFEPFFTTKAPGKGTGLGLSTVYGIVKQSDGNIWVYSEPGRGTTFKVYLPRVEDAAESVQVIKPAPGRGTESILLVEDDEGVRALAREVLEDYGYTVFEARDVADAILIAERHTGPIHLLLSDVVMPQMSGRALAERLAPLRPEMKVLFMSGYTDNAIVHHGRLDSDASFVQKPFTPDALARKVREVLDAT